VGNNIVAGGDGVDTIDISQGGVDTVVFSNGDSGKTLETIDSITGFLGGAAGAGDKLDFNHVQGAASNYVEGSGAADLDAFLAHANSALNSTVHYFAEVVGEDLLVAVSYGSGDAAMVVRLVGVTSLSTIGYQNFVS
jgi:Ca2+-binding RTX toxin-like protein